MPTPEAQQPNPEAFHQLVNPDFDAGDVVAWFSTDPKGFQIETDQSLRRIAAPLGLTPEEKARLRDEMLGSEVKFTGRDIAQDLQAKFRMETDPAKKTELLSSYEEARKNYVDKGNKVKVGIRNPRREGNTLTVDVKPVSYPVLKVFGKPEMTALQRDFSEVAAVSMVIITGDNKLLVSHRGPNNELYPSTPGASSAGAFDGEKGESGKIKPINVDSVLTNIKRESSEELGIEESDYSEITLVGLSEELGPILHHEFNFAARTRLTSEEIRKKSLLTAKARRAELKPEDIDDKYDFIDATPEAIFALVAKLGSPLPKTQIAPFVKIGYDLVLASHGKGKAEEYKTRLETGIRENKLRHDSTVRNYYLAHPEVINQIPQRFLNRINRAVEEYKAKNPNATEEQLAQEREVAMKHIPKRNLNGYSPDYTVAEQGLPEFEPAMKAEGLIAA